MNLAAQILDYIQTQQGDFNRLALEVFSYQYASCLPYQRYCQQLKKTPQEITHWKQVPAVSTEVFREFDLCTLPIETARYVFQTSGTSQEKKGRHYYHDLSLYDAAIENSFMAGLGLPQKPKTLFRVLTPSFHAAPHSSLFYMFQKAVDLYGDSASQFYFKNQELDCDSLAADLTEDCSQNRPLVLLGTAFSFVNFCDYLRDKKMSFRLPPNSRLLETGGLKGRSREISRQALYQLFSTYLGLDPSLCFAEYSMTELSSQCYSASNSAFLQTPVWLSLQIIHPETGQEVACGETGLVQFFDLANLTAVSAILTSDLAVRHPHGFELQGRAPKALLRGCSTAFEQRG